ncbi:P-loop containing nucleoside triphosphate hydrolase protein [Entophlyctis helioformis]|nr:P-loop containing nucleoside triphosphate hydrolase protein [Entophlyctis helioformis]
MGETVFEIGIEDDGSSMHLSATEFATAVERLRVCANQLNSDAVVLHRRYTATLRTSTSAYDQESASGHPETPAAAATSAPTSPVAAWPASPATKPADGADAAVGSHNFGHVLVRRRAGSVENIIELRICVVGNVDAGKSTMLGVLTKDVLDDGRGKARVNLFRHKHEIESGRTSSVGMEMMGYDSTGRVVTPSLLGKPRISWDDICYNASKVITFLDLAGHEKYLKTTVFGMTGCSPDYVMLMVGANAGIIGMTKEHLGLALALQVPVYIVITKIDMCPKNVLESTINQLVKILKSPGCRKIPMFIRTSATERYVCFVSFTATLPRPSYHMCAHGMQLTRATCASWGKIKRSALRKGMVLVSRGAPGDPPPRAVLEFDAEVLVLFHSTTIGEKYQAMVHCGGVRQTARIVGLDKRVLRTGDRAVVRFRFLQRPEYLKVGGRLLFREGRTKGLGKVVRLVSAEEVKAEAAARAAALAAAAAEKAAEKAGNSNSNSNSASAMTGSAASVAVQ